MKISKIRLENFKRFKDLEIDFINGLTRELSDRLLVLGDNGSGNDFVTGHCPVPLHVFRQKPECL